MNGFGREEPGTMSPTPSPRRELSRPKRYLFGALRLVVVLAGLEGALRRMAALIPGNPLTVVPQAVADTVLGVRLSPGYPGHDANGFRNAGVLRKADLVVLGDSMEYGAGIPLERVWPQQLGELTGRPVYNMGVPGYGPVQSLFLLERALAFGPSVVLEAFTAANDLFDAFKMAYYLHDLADLKSTEQDQIAAIHEWENRQTLKRLIDKVYNYRSPAGEARVASLLTRAKLWLDAHVMIYRWLRLVRDYFVRTRMPTDPRLDAERYPEDLLAAGPGVPPTIFTPRYRLAANDLRDPRIREGLNVSLRVIERMSRRVAEEGRCFAVVMIPTKEFVYGKAGDDAASRAPARTSFLSELEQERAVWNRMREYFAEKGIAYVEVAPALSQRLSQGEAVFPFSTDGHPTAAGHDAIAQAVAHSGACGLNSGVR
jgi:hypothetical protein